MSEISTNFWGKKLKLNLLNIFFQRQCRKKPKSDLRRTYFVQVTEETEKKKKELFEKYPCVQMKFRHKTHQNQLNELIISEGFIRLLGYTLEQFADLTLQEGLPR